MKIFVSVVSYRDPLLLKTVQSLLDKKSARHDATIAIFEQTSLQDSLATLAPELIAKKEIKYKRIDPEYADGVCWARYINFLQLTDEDFIYEVDSHMLFDANWDRKLINDYREGVKISGHDRIIITGSCKNFELDNNNNPILHEHPVPMRTEVKYFLYQPDTNILGAHGDIMTSDGYITPAIHICAGNFFTHAKWAKDVGPNPDLYFEGEEQYMVLESFKKGYDMYHMSDIVSYHYINTNQYVTKQWFEPIISMDVYSMRVQNGLNNFKKYINEIEDQVLERFYDKTGVDYINKILDERAKTYSIVVAPPSNIPPPPPPGPAKPRIVKPVNENKETQIATVEEVIELPTTTPDK